MNQLPLSVRGKIFHSLLEGGSIRGTARVFGVDKNTVMWLGADTGKACLAYHQKHVRGLKCAEIQCDEMHSYVHTREEHLLPEEKNKEGRGSYYTWIALDPITKFCPTWHVGRRSAADAEIFIQDLAMRIVGKIQISTDGFKAYPVAIEKAFGADKVDYAQLIKVFNNALQNMSAQAWLETGRHGPRHPPLEATRKVVVSGEPNEGRIATAHVERINLTVRMSLRRYIHESNGHSKTEENHRQFTNALQFYYNFARPHETLTERRKGGAVIKRSPAMAAGLTDRLWTVEELVSLPVPA